MSKCPYTTRNYYLPCPASFVEIGKELPGFKVQWSYEDTGEPVLLYDSHANRKVAKQRLEQHLAEIAAEAMIRENDENPAVIEHRHQMAQRAEADARRLEWMRDIERRTLKAHPSLQ